MFEWDKEIDVEVRIQGVNGPVVDRVKSTPKKIVFEPFNHRPDDIMRSICLVLKEVIIMYEIEAETAQKSMDALQATKAEEKTKKFEFKKG